MDLNEARFPHKGGQARQLNEGMTKLFSAFMEDLACLTESGLGSHAPVVRSTESELLDFEPAARLQVADVGSVSLYIYICMAWHKPWADRQTYPKQVFINAGQSVKLPFIARLWI